MSNLCNFQNPGQGREDTSREGCVSVLLRGISGRCSPCQPVCCYKQPQRARLSLEVWSGSEGLGSWAERDRFSRGGRPRFQTADESAGWCADRQPWQTQSEGARNPGCPRAGAVGGPAVNKTLPFSPPAWPGTQSRHAELGRRQQVRCLLPHRLPRRGGAVRRPQLPPVLLPLQ